MFCLSLIDCSFRNRRDYCRVQDHVRDYRRGKARHNDALLTQRRPLRYRVRGAFLGARSVLHCSHHVYPSRVEEPSRTLQMMDRAKSLLLLRARASSPFLPMGKFAVFAFTWISDPSWPAFRARRMHKLRLYCFFYYRARSSLQNLMFLLWGAFASLRS